MRRTFHKLTDKYIGALIEFAEGESRTVFDTRVHGLKICTGRVRHSWIVYKERRFRGKRKYLFRRIGFFPAMDVKAARQAALAVIAKISEAHFDPGPRAGVRLDAALNAYVAYLRENKTGKSAINAASLSRRYLIPEFGSLTLRELSDSPQLIHDWHKKVSRHSAVSANNAARLLRACYRRAARLDRSLPAALPTSAVEYIPEHAAQSAMPFDQFPAWRQAVEALPPLHRSFHLFCLLTGARGGEAARLTWADVDLRSRSITLRHTKSGHDIFVPLTAAIAGALRMAKVRSPGNGASPRIWAGAVKYNDSLPFKGHALRHTWASVAADLGIDELQRRLLLGHSLSGISQSYVTRAVLSGGPGLRAAQRRVSRRLVELLG